MLLHQLIENTANRTPAADALQFRDETWSYRRLADEVERFACSLAGLSVASSDRIAMFLDKRFETVIGTFGTAAAGCVFVPVNPILKPSQVGHILTDCNVRVLVTSAARLTALAEMLGDCPDLDHVILTDGDPADFSIAGVSIHAWAQLEPSGSPSK